MDLAATVEAARRAALAPEQALLRMVAQRRASPAVLRAAAESYEKAAAMVRVAADEIEKLKQQTPGGQDR